MPASKWTDERLQRLFDRYNRLYWKNRIRHYSVLNHRLKECVGLCERRHRRIKIDVKQHDSDHSVRACLLHEMAHAADRQRQRLSHGVGFWAELEMLLRKRAPIRVDETEMPGILVHPDSIPPQFRLCRRAIKRAQQCRTRYVLRGGATTRDVTDPEIIGDFEEHGLNATPWKDVRVLVSGKYGLIDIGGRPIDAAARTLIRKGYSAYREAVLLRESEDQIHAAMSKLRAPRTKLKMRRIVIPLPTSTK